MWKKDEMGPSTPGSPAQDDRTSGRESPRRTAAPSGMATIGPSITIRGEVSGEEDLLIEGKVDGSVDLKLHSVTVGSEGRVKANISGRVVTVEGEVEGDLKAQDQVILRGTARVEGDITAPRVVLEDGASFRGLVDMGEATQQGNRTGASSGAHTSRRDQTTSSSPGSGTSASGGTDAAKGSNGSPSSSGSTSKSPSRTDKDTADQKSSSASS